MDKLERTLLIDKFSDHILVHEGLGKNGKLKKSLHVFTFD